MPELLVELLSEEIPARMQARAAEELKRAVTAALLEAGLEHGAARACVTPRRLALAVEDVPERQPDLREERRGPRVDAPEKAVAGFLRSAGATREQCEERDTAKGRFLFVVVETEGRDTASALPELLRGAVRKMPWPKSMRWGSGGMRWVRPLESALCVFGGEGIRLAGLGAPDSAGNRTRGHRFLAPAPFEVSGFADYEKKLREAFVVLDREERKAIISRKAAEAAEAEGLVLREDPGLLEEVAGLVEWPVALCGRFDAAFMNLPEEALVTSMRAHQKYFSLSKPGGSLAPRFVVIANTEATDGGAAIVAGNERVLRARLSDAAFFWNQDRKAPLESRLDRLAESAFHAKLGSMAQKAERLSVLSGALASFAPGCKPADAKRAGRLAKADLVTEMVGEFPGLQGAMGRHYALAHGESAAVALAIADHYSPAGPADNCPDAPVSVAVALADKLDTLAGFFAIGETPTGSRDPYALRRAALGVIRLILENGLRLPLQEAFRTALNGYPESIRDSGGRGRSAQAELGEFFADRLKVHLRDQGVRHDHIAAVLNGEDDLVRLLSRVHALSDFLDTDEGGDLLSAYRRANNIVTMEEKKDRASYDGRVDRNRLSLEEELFLETALDGASASAKSAIAEENYVEAMKAMAALRGPVDRFFDRVTVNAEDADVRANRLRLLSRFRSTLGGIADFSLIEAS